MSLKSRIREFENCCAVIGVMIAFFCSCGVSSGMMATAQGNKVYVVKEDWDLKGEKVSLPQGCTLKFEGGSIKNGTLVGNGTLVKMEQEGIAFDDVVLQGSFVAEEFPINAYCTNNLDYFYGFLQAFSGANLYLTDDYSATEYLGISDGTTPRSLNIDGMGHKLTLYSFGAYKVQQGSIKNVTIDCRNNIDPKNKWKQDRFTFGVVGEFDKSALKMENVIFTKECGFAYIRGFKKLEVSRCKENGSYFFVYDCNEVSFHNNSIVNAANGYYSIGRMTEAGKVEIRDNEFCNIKGGGVILSGGLKYNVSITKNVLENVGGGGAMKACINIHPRGTINVCRNRIVANKGATTLDIDAAGEKYFSNKTTVTVENNIIRNVAGDISIHSMALVGLGKLYFRHNEIKDQLFYFWDTPYMEFCNNTMAYSKGFDNNVNIGKMSTHAVTEGMDYQHIYRDNVFDIPSSKGYVKFEYLSKAKVRIKGERNRYSKPVSFVDQYKKFEATGDIRIYK